MCPSQLDLSDIFEAKKADSQNMDGKEVNSKLNHLPTRGCGRTDIPHAFLRNVEKADSGKTISKRTSDMLPSGPNDFLLSKPFAIFRLTNFWAQMPGCLL
jgi:hypothetical protein